jgi:Lrp/AsnC family transcriptional regulator, leucine-responsive regulatory protein
VDSFAKDPWRSANQRNRYSDIGERTTICCVKLTIDPSVEIDPVDHHILALLASHARMTFAEIGADVSLSASAVKRRIDRLEQSGVITGYTVVLNHVDGVQAVFTTAGDPDAIVWLRVRDVDELKTVIDHIRRTGKVIGTKTLMVLGRSERSQSVNIR